MKNILFIFLISVIIAFANSCNKSDPPATIDPATGCTNCTPSTATTFVGLFRTGTYTVTAPASTTTITTRASAFFSSQPINVSSVANSVTVANVFFNSDTLKYSGAPNYYTNYTPINLASETWSVNGSSSIPSFTFKNLKEKPSFLGIGALPDTVRRSVGFSFIIYGLQNMTAASVYISDGWAIPSVFTKALNVGTDTLVFSAQNLTAVNTSTNASITVFMENSFAVTVDGKDFKMSNETSFTKNVVIKN